jgi:hypothetical protein
MKGIKYWLAGNKHPGGKNMEQLMKDKSKENPLLFSIHIIGDFRLKWFEYGTIQRTTKKRYNANRGAIKPKPFLRPAML